MSTDIQQRLDQQMIRIEGMTMSECGEEHRRNAEEWERRVHSDNKPSFDEAIYHGRLQNMLYIKSVGEGA